MSKYNWSADQLRAIEAEHSVIVSASAGSGKTTLMIERILRLVKRGTPIENMLVVTFANAQAEDMKAKLEERLSEELAGGAPEEERARLRRSLYALSGADISTLHAFCANVVRSYFYLIDADANFRIASETDTRLRCGAACETVIAAELENGRGDFLALYDALSINRRHDVLKSCILRIAAFQATLVEGADLWKKTALVRETARAEQERARTFYRRAFEAEFEDFAMRAEGAGDSVRAAFARECVARARAADWHTAELGRVPSKKEDTDPVLHEELKTLKSALNETLRELDRDCDYEVPQPYVGVLERLAKAYRATYRKLKERDGVLDFNDLERKCLEVLAIDDAAETLRKKYRYIFVDEYQDINAVQQEIIARVASDNVFMVGDVKQSIYGFRLCDPAIFCAKYAELEPLGRAVDLNANYRSAGNVLEFCNFLFDGLMTEDFGEVDYAKKARFRAAKAPVVSPAVELCLLRTESDEEDAEPEYVPDVYSVRDDRSDSVCGAAYYEGRLVAQKIREIYGRVYDGRTLAYRDMAVLLRDMKAGAEEFVRALKDSGIPVAIRRDYDLLAAPGVAALSDLLRVLANPCEDFALLGVMKSPLFRFREDELAEIRRGTKTEYYHEAVFAYAEARDETADKVRAMFAELADWRRKAQYMPPSEVLATAIAETDYYGGLLERADGAVQDGLARRFVSEVARSGYNTDLVTYLDYLGQTEQIFVELTDGGADSVTVTTMHKSKGLEYGAVFLARLGRKFSEADKRDEVYVDRDFGVVMQSYDAVTRTKESNALREAAARRMTFRGRQEELRLLYVACTRAKYKLYLVASGKFAKPVAPCTPRNTLGACRYMDWILSVVQQDAAAAAALPYETAHRLVSAADYRIGVYACETCAKERRDPVIPNADEGWTREIVEAMNARYAFDGSTRIPAKTTATRLNERDEAATEREHGNRVEAFDRDGGENRGAAKGNAYHKIMQYYDFARDDAETHIAELVASGRLDEDEAVLVDAGEIAAAARAVRAIPHTQEERELAFVAKFAARDLYADSADDTPVVVQGVADLVLSGGGEAALVDYKTTRTADAEALRAKYATQLRIYAAACNRAGYRIGRAYIWSFPLKALVEIDL